MMRALFSKPVLSYMIGLFILVGLTGGILSLVIDDYIILITVLMIQFIVLIIFVMHIFDKYVRPIQKSIKTVDELVKGNYRARIHHPFNGSIGELSNKINTLARSLSELAIQEDMQENQLSTIIDNTESGLVLIDEKGYIHLVNRKFLSMFGKTSKYYKGYLYYDVIDIEKIHETVQKTFMYEESIKVSFTQQLGLDKRYIEVVGAPIFNERNMFKGALLALYDITELKNLEIMRKDFVANVSHELKTPITSIKGFAETLLDDDMQDEKKRNEFLYIIYHESNRLQLLVEDLLTLSKLEKDEFELELTDVSIKDIIHEIVPIVNHKAETAQLSFAYQVADIPPVVLDKERMKQVIINLLDNAISYTLPGGTIKLNVYQQNEHLHIQISDTGIGIREDVLPRIFERFYRVDKARSRNTGGTGLGLAIVKHIVEVHDGEINVESIPNEGSTFNISVPLKQENEDVEN